MSYEYKRPEGDKYKVSIREWNKVFPKRGTWPFVSVTVYVSGLTEATIEFTTSKTTKSLLVVLAPIFYLYGILVCGLSQAHKEYLDALFDRRRGAFSSDMAYNRDTESWRKLMKLINRPW